MHVGPHKTGTTALQGALHAARGRLAEHGVWLPSPSRNPVEEIKEGVRPRPDDPDRGRWRRLVEAVAQTGERIGVISSEFFADAEAEGCRRVVDDLGGPDVHIVVTLRPLAKILPSQWQQHVQSGMSTHYEPWLEALFEPDPTDRAALAFWHRHRHDRFVERWAEAAGEDRVTVLVVDDRERDRLLLDFAALLGLPEGTLRPAKGAGNRSLTAAEIEIVRHCAEASEKRGWHLSDFRKYVRYGVVPRLKTGRTPPPEEARIATPAWAVARAAEIGSSMAERITETGVRVIGDLDLLAGKHVESAEAGEHRLDPSVTAQAILSCMSVVLRDGEAAAAAAAEVERARSQSILRTVSQRARGRLARNRNR
ncbi:hypothetical protein L0U85_11325 [Glycomyces sp. L485]|uniref:hypothetical protein n=1 Tax=Glycomyces sp. L485 TaxID=2909235 RepID=UPI001F4AC168|nr:hypothetical protein [Glycomyces sp. L485]MCH7231435.1 hypothetical protein [Glycomyces sp. L485]